jgi:hypothetical protein
MRLLEVTVAAGIVSTFSDYFLRVRTLPPDLDEQQHNQQQSARPGDP